MPYTFGAGGGDDISYGVNTTMGGGSRIELIAGWWRPTTLTAGRGLWSAGTVFGARIHTTTDELELRTDNATTDGTWTTTGVDLAVNEWTWLGFLASHTASATAWRVYRGNLDQPPTPVTVTAGTAPSGNLTGNGTITLGNLGTSSVAFQGDIAHVTTIASATGVGVTSNPFGVAAFGSFTANEQLHLEQTLINPLWLGDLTRLFAKGGSAGNWDVFHNNLDIGARVVGNPKGSANVQPLPAISLNGATSSLNGAPRPQQTMPLYPRRRR